MEYAYLQASKSTEMLGFGYMRWHLINYILRQGKQITGTDIENAKIVPLPEGDRIRTNPNEAEFGVVIHENGFYSYFIEQYIKHKDRKLTIVVGSTSKEDLDERVSSLMKNTNLEIVDCSN